MIETERLLLRSWHEGDGAEFARVTNTPEVMEHLGGVEDPIALADTAGRLDAIEREHGFTFWAIERKEDGALLGFCGVKPANVAPLLGELEIGWRLRHDCLGAGLCARGGASVPRLGLGQSRGSANRRDHGSGEQPKLGADGAARHGAAP